MNRIQAEEWNELWQVTEADAVAMKDPIDAVEQMAEAYRHIADEDREIINKEIAKSVRSADPLRQYDALALVRQFHITEALDDLIALGRELQSSDRPGAMYDHRIVMRLIAMLESPA